MIYHFYLALEDSDPLVWRRIIVPGDYSLYKLHLAIQGAFGWENVHLFQFSEKDLGDRLSYAVPCDEDELEPGFVKIDAREAYINQVFKKVKQSFSYIYDFGDYWRHRVIFEKKEMKDMYLPFCLGGSGACPPEDVGGMGGYQEMLEVFRQKDHPGKDEIQEWIGLAQGEDWDPFFCSIREVNKRLCLLE